MFAFSVGIFIGKARRVGVFENKSRCAFFLKIYTGTYEVLLEKVCAMRSTNEHRTGNKNDTDEIRGVLFRAALRARAWGLRYRSQTTIYR